MGFEHEVQDEQLYYLTVKKMELNRKRCTNYMKINDKTSKLQTQFTEKEINELDKKSNVLEQYKKVEINNGKI